MRRSGEPDLATCRCELKGNYFACSGNLFTSFTFDGFFMRVDFGSWLCLKLEDPSNISVQLLVPWQARHCEPVQGIQLHGVMRCIISDL